MNITELDEWQGLTAELVQQWAEAHGYQYRISGLVKGGYVSFANPLRPDAIVWLVPLLADRAKLSLQAFLREINPRMRKGVPSQEAITAHGGTWMAAPPLGRNGIVFVNLRVLLDPSWAEWSFWPCDDHGNKVLWPTDANGEML